MVYSSTVQYFASLLIKSVQPSLWLSMDVNPFSFPVKPKWVSTTFVLLGPISSNSQTTVVSGKSGVSKTIQL